MLYSEYEKKILKLAKIKNLILKYKVLIISVLAVLITGSATLLAVKGNISGEISVSQTITYGDEIKIDGVNALFSDVSYQYSTKGSNDWTFEVPTLPGEYEVRAYSKGAFGKNKYSDISYFTILPREASIDITSNTVEYGSAPSYDVSLALGDQISYIQFMFDDISKNTTKVCANKETIKVVDEEGNDVTKYYSFKTPSSNIEFIKKSVLIKPTYASKVYDGTPLIYDNTIEDITLPYGDIPSYSNTITDKNGNIITPITPGEYINTINDVKITNNNIDTTINYDIRCESNILKIEKRSITVKTNDLTKVYDGNPLFDSKITISDSSLYDLIEGHEIVVRGYASIKDVGVLENKVSFDILDENRNVVTDYYDISYEYGALTINPIEIGIQTLDFIATYNGLNQGNPEYKYITSSNEILSNHHFEIISYASYKNIGTYKNEIALRVVENKSDVSKNYKITYSFGEIVIQKRVVEIKPKDHIKDYDGISFRQNEYEIITSNLNQTEEVIITTNEEVNAGIYELNIQSYKILEDGIDITKNFDIIRHTGLLTINKVDVTIKSIDNQYEYDGNVYNKYNGSELEYVKNGLIKGNLSVQVNYYDSKYNLATPINAGTYYIKIINHSLTGDLASNYNIIYSNDYSILTINPRKLDISPLLIEYKEYDGNYITYKDDINNFILNTNYNLTDKIKIKVSFNGIDGATGVKDAGGYTISFVDYEVVDGLKENYLITFNEGTFNIKKRTINISLNNHIITYGDSFTYDINDFNLDKELVLPDFISVNVLYDGNYNTPINVGVYEISINEINLNGNINNYEFIKKSSKLTINQAELIVDIDESNLSRTNLEYNGEEIFYLSGEDNYLQAEGLKYNDRLEIVVGFKLSNNIVEAINANTYEFIITDYLINGLDSNNYLIKIKETKYLTIQKRAISISPIDKYSTYTGEAFEYDSSEFSYNSVNTLVGSDSILVNVKYIKNNNSIIPINVGEYIIQIDSYILNGNKNNYDITYDGASILLIEPKTIYITSKSILSKRYDGNSVSYELTEGNYELKGTNLVGSDNLIAYFKFRDSNGNLLDSVVNAGRYGIIYVSSEFTVGSSANYEIIQREDDIKTFRIDPKNINLKPVDHEMTYGDEFNYNNALETNNKEFENVKIEVEYYLDDVLVESPRDIGEYEIRIKSHSITGLDLNNYSINTSSGILTINPRLVTLYVNAENAFINKTYDGVYFNITNKEGNYLDYEENVVNGDILTLNLAIIVSNNQYITYTKVKDANDYSVILTGYSVNQGNPFNYEVTLIPHEFTISPIQLKLKPFDSSRPYTSKYFTYSRDVNNFELLEGSGSIVTGESIEINVDFYDESDTIIVPRNAGTYKIRYDSHEVYNSLYENYEIIYVEDGTLIITNALVTIKPILDRTSHEYDGTEFSFDGRYEIISVEGVSEDYIPSLDVSAYFYDEFNNKYEAIRDAGSYKLKIINHLAFDLDQNVEIVYDDIEYIITPREISLGLYDGGSIDYNNEYYNYTLGIDFKDLGLGNGDSFKSIHYSYYQNGIKLNNNPKDVGSYEIRIEDYVLNGKESNYIINKDYKFGSITINKLKVVVIPNNQTKVYDKEAFTYPVNDYSFKDNVIYENDLLNVNVGITSLKDSSNYIEAVNVGKYYIRILSIDESSLEKNYDITFDDTYAVLDITPIVLNIKSDQVFNDIYYGDDIYKYESYLNNFITNSSTILENDLTIKVLFKKDGILYEEAKDSGVYELYLDSFETNNLGLSDSNYKVSLEYYQFEIKKRVIKVEDLTKFSNSVYGDDYNYSYNEYYDNYNLLQGSLQYGEKLKIALSFKDENDGNIVRNVGTYRVNLSYYVTDNLGKNDSNYEVIFDEYEFEILKRDIKIELIEPTNIYYDGEKYEYNPKSFNVISDNDIVYGDDLRVKVYYTYQDDLNKKVDPIYSNSYYIWLDEVYMPYEGIDNYNILPCDKIPFTINKRAISIKPYDITINYGDELEYINEANNFIDVNNTLIDNAYIDVYFNDLNNSVKNVGAYDIYVKSINFDTTEIANSYEISYDTAKLLINKLAMTIAPECIDMEYKKDYYLYEKQVVLKYDDILTFDLYYEDIYGSTINPINVGVYYAYINNAYINGVDYRIDGNYDFTFDYDSFSITPKNAYITPLSIDNRYYNGSNLEYIRNINNCYVEGLLDNLDIEITVKYLKDSIYYDNVMDVGRYQICLKDVICNDELASNYKFIQSDNEIFVSINPAKITLSPQSPNNKTYDANYIYASDYQSYVLKSGSIYGDTIKLNVLFNGKASAVDANTYNITLDSYLVNGKKYNADEVSNYEITFILESFEIYKRIIEISIKDSSTTYTSYLYDEQLTLYEIVGENEFLNDEIITIHCNYYVDDSLYEGIPINAGSYKMIYKNSSLSDNANNYEIVVINDSAILKINPRNISVEVKDDIITTYNGSAYKLDNSYYTITSGSLALNDSLTINVSYNTDLSVNVTPINAGIYYIIIDDVNLSCNIDNYIVDLSGELKTLTINQKDVEIELITANLTYDGNAYSYPYSFNNYISATGLLKNAYVLLDVSFKKDDIISKSITNSGSYEMIASVVDIANDYKENYRFTYINTIQAIENRAIIVYTGSNDSFIYDDQVKTYCSEGTYGMANDSLYSLVSGQKLYVLEPFEAIDAGTHENRVVLGVIDDLGNDYSNNYDITYNYGTITISKINISITSGSMEFTYNGEYQSCADFTYEGALIEGHRIFALPITSLKDVTDNPEFNVQQYYIFRQEDLMYVYANMNNEEIINEYNKAGNYDIDRGFGKVSVNPFDINITFNDVRRPYDSKDFIYDLSYAILSNQFYDECEIEYSLEYNGLSNKKVINEAGTYILSFTTIKFDDEDMIKNYNITFNNATAEVIIDHIEINITTASYSGYYNMKKQYLMSESDYSYNIEALVLNHTFELEDVDKQPYVFYPGDEVLNKLLFKVLDEDLRDVTSNYIINYESIGTLRLYKDLNLSFDNALAPYTGLAILDTISYGEVLDLDLALVDDYTVKATKYDLYQNGVKIDNPKDIGIYDVVVTSYNLYYKNRLIDSSIVEMFNVNILEGCKFEVTKINLLIKPKDTVITYDGLEKFVKGYYNSSDDYSSCVDIIEGELAYNHALIVTETSGSGILPGTYKTYITSFEMYDMSTNTILNNYEDYYNITYFSQEEPREFEGRLRIEKITIEVKTGGAKKQYDGNYLYCNEYEIITPENLLDGHYIELIENGSGMLNVGSRKNRLSFVVYDEFKNNVSLYYDFEYTADSGYLEITAINLEITDIDVENGTYTLISGELIVGHEFTFDINKYGEITYDIWDSNSLRVTKNYNVVIV